MNNNSKYSASHFIPCKRSIGRVFLSSALLLRKLPLLPLILLKNLGCFSSEFSTKLSFQTNAFSCILTEKVFDDTNYFIRTFKNIGAHTHYSNVKRLERIHIYMTRIYTCMRSNVFGHFD